MSGSQDDESHRTYPLTVADDQRGSGMRWAASSAHDADAVAAELRNALSDGATRPRFAQILAFFSSRYEPAKLAEALEAAFPGTPLSGCMTAGEIGPGGADDGAVVLVAFPSGRFTFISTLIPDLASMRVEDVGDRVRELRCRLPHANDKGSRSPVRPFALLMVDGLSNVEEMLVAAIHFALDDIPLVGGSAGDGLAFRHSSLIHDGRAIEGAALLMMAVTDVPFEIFKTQDFEPTPTKLVVTAADTARRVVHELNAEPAAREYASAIGLLTDDLGPFSFASYPLVVRVGGDYYCRSIRNMNPDGSLTFFCAIDEGLVFTVARPVDLKTSADATLSAVERRLGGIDMVLGFDCVLRRLDAENRQVGRELASIYARYRVVGFYTYGEQYNAMHLNQTLTGIAFGRQVAPP